MNLDLHRPGVSSEGLEKALALQDSVCRPFYPE
jgi:hypothetical protein